jgi:hypothetical protein
VQAILKSLSAQNTLPVLIRTNVGVCIVLFLLLQVWRPCFFLTDDNLSSLFPLFTEMGRHLKDGRSPFISDYLFGGNYDLTRDIGFLYWHPFYLIPTVLSDTWARFWILDAVAILFFILTTVGFTILTHRLRSEFNQKLPDVYLTFYTMSYLFSTYILMTCASWINFLGNQSALPWLVLGILDKRLLRGTFLIALFTIHEYLGAFAGLTLSNTLCLTVFAIGAAFCKRSFSPCLMWGAGKLLGLVVLAPFLLHALDGFAHATRFEGLTLKECSDYFIPASIFPFSFFFGNWSEPLAGRLGETALIFPYPSVLLACGAAWCLLPAL